MAEDLTHTVAGPTATPPNPPGYELLEEIGHGGMGVVYRARDTTLDRDVAVKLLPECYPADSPAAQRFLREARITGQLQHPGIPAVHQVGVLPDGRPFLAMKLIKGRTLHDILRQRPDPTADRGQLLAIFEAVCQAVGYAHAHRVIHRDLKPANVMVGAFGEVQVMDWGLAKSLTNREREQPGSDPRETRAWTQIGHTPETGSETQAGSLVGTPAFIPPEQAVGEIERVNERSDVFGLGALLAVILTGQPPYVGETGESVRVQALRGTLEDCFDRLDVSGAEPELVALCKNCLAFDPEDRPADAGGVAAAVAGLRAASDERARRAELERVRVEGAQAMALARAAERRKRRRLMFGAAAVLALAAVGGLTAVVVVQRRANAELAEQQTEVEARFETAQKAIATFHTGVSEDFLLQNAEFRELRTKLLKEAAGFYADLEKLLAGKTDPKSRKLLADGYYQLGDLTDKIGDKKEALAIHRKALALRQELAAIPQGDVETRLNVARSLEQIGWLLFWTGDTKSALATFEEERHLIEQLEAEYPTDPVRTVLARCHMVIGIVYDEMGKLEESLISYRVALAIQQKLADANPTVSDCRHQLAIIRYNVGRLLAAMGKPGEALAEYRKALPIERKLVDANPAVSRFPYLLGNIHNNIGINLLRTGKPAEAMEAYGQALAIFQKLAGANRAVADFQYVLSLSHTRIGHVQAHAGKAQEAMASYQEALAICQKVCNANPTVSYYQQNLATVHINIARLLARQKRFTEALAALDAGQAISKTLTEANPKDPAASDVLGYGHAYRGWTLIQCGQSPQAVTDLRIALEQWSKRRVPDNENLFERSRALALLARLGGETNPGVTTAEAATFADQAVSTLRDALRAGWPWPDELKEPDFDAIRGREDFKKLLAESQAESGAKVTPRP
jgi:tetratricopeptide (TPR) repeat protein